MAEVDLINRDPNNINDHLKVSFEDVLAEPDGAHSIDCVWKLSYTCFNCGLNLCYKLATLCCGLCIALYWGCDFAATAFNHVWCWTPCLKDFAICLGCSQKVFETCVQCCMAPICETCALCFSKVKVAKS